MSPATVKLMPEDEIRTLADAWLSAVLAGDVDKIVAHYAPNILAFDAIGDLRYRGRDAYKTHWQACLAMCPGPMSFEMHDLEVVAGGDVAFAHCLGRCGATDDKGEEHASWMRATIGFRKIDGRWLMVHEHWSAPFEPQSGKALLDLEP